MSRNVECSASYDIQKQSSGTHSTLHLRYLPYHLTSGESLLLESSKNDEIFLAIRT